MLNNDILEVDPEQCGTLILSTLAATYLQYNSTNKSNTYGWLVDWKKVLGEEHRDIKYEVDHLYFGNYQYMGNFVVGGLQSFSTGLASQISPNQLVTNLPLTMMASDPAAYNPSNRVFNTINFLFEKVFVYSGLNTAAFMWPYAKKKTFRCDYPGNNPYVQITALTTISTKAAGAATNTVSTSLDQFTSGVHMFTFKRLRPRSCIPRCIVPELTGVLTLLTTASNVQQFDATTGTQTYTWNNIQWGQVLGFVTPPSDSVWEVTHSFVCGALPTQSINNATPGFPSANPQGCPFFPVFFVGCNVQGNNNTPNVFNTINLIYCQLTQIANVGGFINFLIATLANETKYVTRNPFDFSSLTIATRPSYQTTYISSTGPTVNTPIVSSYPADYYTNGVHTFKFRLLKRK